MKPPFRWRSRAAGVVVLGMSALALDHPVRTAQATATGELSGVVTAVDGGITRPVAGARLSATSTGERGTETTTDASGRFSLTGLAEGRYRLVASRAGFLTAEFGAFHPGQPGTAIVLAAGERIGPLQIELQRGGVIAGTVTRTSGEPASFIGVTASTDDGVSGSATTDEHGAYRIEGLAPGTYSVAAAVVPVKGRNRSAPFFFPGTFDPARAEKVTVGPSEERGGVAFTLPSIGTAKVNGRLVTETGEAPGRAAVSLWTPRALVRDVLRVDASGAFAVTDVMPGSYLLRATYGPPPAGGARDLEARLNWAPTHFAFQTIEIPATGEIDVVLRLTGVATVTGELRTTGSPGGATTAPTVVVSMTPVGSPGPVIGAAGTTEFEVRGVLAGSYRLDAEVREDNSWWVASIERQGANLLIEPLAVESGSANVGGIVVTLGRGRSDLSGRVLDRSGGPASGYWVALIPSDPRSWDAQQTGAMRVRPDTSGAFEFRDVPAREYVLALADDSLPGRWRTVEVLEPLVRSGVRVMLAAGQPARQDIRIR